MMANQRNILILITDQQTYHAMSCAGNPWLSTPAMDALAQRGTRFTRAYCSYPLCSPARASQMTGKYPHQVNVNGNESRFFWYHDIPRDALMGHTFAQAGYRCLWAGKDMPPGDGSRDFELLAPWGDSAAADRLVEFLGNTHDQPFLAVGNFVNPHNICEYAQGKTLPEGKVGTPPPLREMPLLPANHGIPPYEPEIIRTIQQQGHVVYLPQHYTDDAWRDYLWAYYRLVEKVDGEIGRVLDALDGAGLRDETLVIFTADHGDGCAAHRWNQKQVLYEEVIRVPLILAGPGVAPGREETRLASASMDLFLTCCAFAGIDPPNDLEGRSLLSIGDETAWRDAIIVETALNAERGNDRPARNRGRAVVMDRWKYMVWAWGRYREHLVDLEADPGEMVNLATSDRYQGIVETMRQRLDTWRRRTGDTFEVPGHTVVSPEAGEYEQARIDAGTRWPWQIKRDKEAS
jgi:arylsulfatase A-like enzyme